MTTLEDGERTSQQSKSKSRSKSPSSRRHRSRSRSRTRSKSPLPFLHRRQHPISQNRGERRATREQPTNFRRGQLIIVIDDQQKSKEREWKALFQLNKYRIYDVKYPIRIGCETILRRNKGYKFPTRFHTVDLNRFVDFMHDKTYEFFGVDFEFDYFMDWFMSQPEADRDKPTVIFGSGCHPGSAKMLNCLKFMGAMVVGADSPFTSYPVKTYKDMESFIRRCKD